MILQSQCISTKWAPVCHLPAHSVCPKLWLPPPKCILRWYSCLVPPPPPSSHFTASMRPHGKALCWHHAVFCMDMLRLWLISENLKSVHKRQGYPHSCLQLSHKTNFIYCFLSIVSLNFWSSNTVFLSHNCYCLNCMQQIESLVELLKHKLRDSLNYIQLLRLQSRHTYFDVTSMHADVSCCRY